jgi:hypothetical protein
MSNRRHSMATYAVTFAEKAGATVAVQVEAQNQAEAIQHTALWTSQPETSFWLGMVLEVREIAP